MKMASNFIRFMAICTVIGLLGHGASLAQTVERSEIGDVKVLSVHDDDGNIVANHFFDRATGKELSPFGARALEARREMGLPMVDRQEAIALPPATLPPDTLVRIRLLNTLHSGRNSEGDRFGFEVVDNVFSGDRLWIRKGTHGVGTITELRRAGIFGVNGKIVSSFGMIPIRSGGEVQLTMSRKATKENDQDKLAAGASVAGALVLGPVGLVGGAFVEGRNVVIPAGSELYVATEEEARM